MVIGRDLWLDTVRCDKYIKSFKEYIPDEFSVSRYLVREKLAIKNENHLMGLRKKCEIAGFIARNEPTIDENIVPDEAGSSNSGDAGETQVRVPFFAKKMAAYERKHYIIYLVT